MSVKIRMTRMGREKAPYFRIVVADSRRARDGRVVEYLGRYQPLQPNDNLMIDEERALYWLSNGATPSNTVRALLRRQGILRKFHEARFGPSVKPGTEQYHQKRVRPVEPVAKPAPAAEAAPETTPVAAEPASVPAEQSVAPATAPEAAPAASAPEATV